MSPRSKVCVVSASWSVTISAAMPTARICPAMSCANGSEAPGADGLNRNIRRARLIARRNATAAQYAIAHRHWRVRSAEHDFSQSFRARVTITAVYAATAFVVRSLRCATRQIIAHGAITSSSAVRSGSV